MCQKCDAEGERFQFGSRSGVLRHMKQRKFHQCTFHMVQEMPCGACKKLGNKMIGNKIDPTRARFVCRHTPCTRSYAQASSRWRHEFEFKHTCDPESECPECTRTEGRKKKRRVSVRDRADREETDEEIVAKLVPQVQDFSEMLYAFISAGGGFTVTPTAPFLDMLESKGSDAFVFWVDGELGTELPDTINATNIGSLLSCSTVEPDWISLPEGDAASDERLAHIPESGMENGSPPHATVADTDDILASIEEAITADGLYSPGD